MATFSRKVLYSANCWATVVQQEKESIQMAKGLSKLNIDKTFGTIEQNLHQSFLKVFFGLSGRSEAGGSRGQHPIVK